jgi:hypothetical protein
MGVLFVQADVLPEYDSAREKLVNIEMRANVADFPEWVFIQKLSRSHDDVVYFEVIDEEGILGCDRSQYIEELLAVPSLSFEERQQLMEYTTQMEAEINQYSELWNVCRET